VDKCIARASTFKLRCQSASIPEAMRASKFSLAESSDPAKQMAVRRAYAKVIRDKTKAAPTTVSILSPTSGSSLSPMTGSPRTESTAKSVGTQTPERDIQAKPKARQIRHTATGMQKWQVNKFNLSKHSKGAFKRATSWYDQEVHTKRQGWFVILRSCKKSEGRVRWCWSICPNHSTICQQWPCRTIATETRHEKQHPTVGIQCPLHGI